MIILPRTYATVPIFIVLGNIQNLTDDKIVFSTQKDGSIKINNVDYTPTNLKKIATSGLASDAVVTCATDSALATITGSTENTNVQVSLEALAGKVKTIQGGMVTSIDGGAAYNVKGVEITLDTDKITGDVKVSVASSNLDNVATLHYDSVNATTEDFSLYGVVVKA